jgi:predicted ATPase
VRFSRLVLTNFRSFGPEPAEIEFAAEENLVGVVGANNAGKSNLIDAFRLVLGQRRDVGESDFWRRNTDVDLKVELFLAEPLKVTSIFKSTDEVIGFYFRAHRLSKGDDRGVIQTDHYAYKDKYKVYVPAATIRSSKPADPEAVPRSSRPEPANNLIRRLGPTYYLGPSLADDLKLIGRGPLARLLDLYRDAFEAEHNTYTLPSGEQVPSIEAYRRFMSRLDEILRTPKLTAIEERLTLNLRAFLGPAERQASVIIGLPPARDLLRRLLRLEIADDPEIGPLLVDSLGAGYRSLLRIALIQNYVDIGGTDKPAVFLLEEPEAYLHPHLRRHFRRSLESLAEQGHTIVLATHDSAFVDIARPRSFVRLARGADLRSVVFSCDETVDLSYERVARKLRGYGNEELPFARVAVLCEGQDDAAVVRVLADRLGIDLDALSVTVVDCGSRDKLARLHQAHRTAWDSVSRSDGQRYDQDGFRQLGRKEGKKTVEHAVAIWRWIAFAEDIERALGTQKQASGNLDHLVAVVEALSLPPVVGSELEALAESLQALCLT